MGVAVALTGLLLVSACGKQAPKQAAKASTTSAFTGDPNGPYCRLTLARDIGDVKSEMHHAKPGSAEEIKGIADYAVFLEKGEKIAPLEMKAAFHTFATHYQKTLEPLFAKYGNDEARFDKEATAAEKKLANSDPPPNIQKAFGTILRYESQVCGVGGPKSADVKFTGSSKSQTCVLYRKDQTAHDKWLGSDFSAKANREFFTGRMAVLDARDRAASADPAIPAAIKKSIHTYAVHYRTKQLPALAKFEYDWLKTMENGTADDRHAITDSDPDVWDQVALGGAYDDQVCSA
jgi:hypothetical protein